MSAQKTLVPFENVDPDVARRLRPGVSFLVSAKTFAQVADEMAMATPFLPRLDETEWITPSGGMPDEAGDAIPASEPRDPTSRVE